MTTRDPMVLDFLLTTISRKGRLESSIAKCKSELLIAGSWRTERMVVASSRVLLALHSRYFALDEKGSDAASFFF